RITRSWHRLDRAALAARQRRGRRGKPPPSVTAADEKKRAAPPPPSRWLSRVAPGVGAGTFPLRHTRISFKGATSCLEGSKYSCSRQRLPHRASARAAPRRQVGLLVSS